MRVRLVMVLLAAMGLTRHASGSTLSQPSNPLVSDSVLRLPVIPLWDLQSVAAAQTDDALGLSWMSGESTQDCPTILQFSASAYYLAPHADSTRKLIEIYVGDFANNRVVRHVVDSSLTRTVEPLPIPYGVAWLAEDLDSDGNIELVLQRGDLGLGGNGWLDILSAPDWTPRGHFVFPGMKVEMNPVAVNVDGDPYLEIFASPSSLGGNSVGVLIDFDPVSDTFKIVSQIALPAGSAGHTASADFDYDGRMEFVLGNDYGYGLLEWRDSSLQYIGLIGNPAVGNDNWASTVRPKPGGQLYALLGHSYTQYTYDLVRATADNVFTVERVFAEQTPYSGITPNLGADVDCDGLDELTMLFYPSQQVWEWNDTTKDFVRSCLWSADSVGTLVHWYALDVNWDGAPDWLTVNHTNMVRCFVGGSCAFCDSTGHCTPPARCNCPCAADPACDSVKLDVTDVSATINVAFRGSEAITDVRCAWSRTDVDCSGTSDVLDVVKVINVAFRGAAAEFCAPCL